METRIMTPRDGLRKEPNEPWTKLAGDFVCTCGRPLRKKGMMRELRNGKNYRMGPTISWIRSGICTIRMDCHACGRSWDARYLVCARYDAGPGKGAPRDVWGLKPGEDPEARLREIVAAREAAKKQPERRIPAPEPARVSTEADAALAKRRIAEIRKAMGWV